MIREEQKIDKMLSRHYKILDLHLAGVYTQEQIASLVGVTSATVRNIINSPTFQHECAQRRSNRAAVVDELDVRHTLDTTQEARTLLAEKAGDAARATIALLGCEDVGVRLRASQDILDRAGIPKVTKTENLQQNAVIVLSDEMAKALTDSLSLAFPQGVMELSPSFNLQEQEAGDIIATVLPFDPDTNESPVSDLQTPKPPVGGPHDPPQGVETQCPTEQALLGMLRGVSGERVATL